MKEETKKAIKQEFVKLGKNVLSNVVTTLEDIVVILITDSDNKLDDTFIPFIAGYTSWGYPYGILEAEEEDIEADSDELPF